MTSLDATLLEVLGCPECKGRLEQWASARGPELRCGPCQASWPVEDGVPQLLPESKRRTEGPARG
ncbi:Trm112 family protein [Myxococcus dinghuensis]|uniref:Trm112 family protein n=1 Tax=Myxococcus dinghuensis TaxID=2906761 RepID=UPI002B1EFD01|nr:Trm112 family protein [Myxococcus dinghuensis]